MADKQAIISCLGTKTIAAIPDEHQKSENRKLVKELLQMKSVKAFFFEWERNDGLNATLSKIPFSLGKKDIAGIKHDLSSFFQKAALDAEPGIPDLVATDRI